MASGLTGNGSAPDESGVLGEAADGAGVVGLSHAARKAGIIGINDNQTNQAGVGVHGRSAAAGVVGESTTWHGVFGRSESTTGGHGVSGDGGVGVSGIGRTWIGVYGETHAAAEAGAAAVWGDGMTTGDGVKGIAKGPGKAAVCGFHQGVDGGGGPAVFGDSAAGRGVHGQGQVGVAGIGSVWIGVYGETNARPEAGSAGVWGEGKTTGDGVKGVAHGPGKAAVCGFQLGNNGPGVYGEGAPAGFFKGDVIVTGDVKLAGADLAEKFHVDDPAGINPGSVVVAAGQDRVQLSDRPYDHRVVGVVSGAGTHRPGLILDHQSDGLRLPLALTGKVWCLVDADRGPIETGDLLTTSPTPGHAMKATDSSRAFGAVLGKALGAMPSGRGLLQVLIALQ